MTRANQRGEKKCYSGAETPISRSVQAGVGMVECVMKALAPELTNGLQGLLQLHKAVNWLFKKIVLCSYKVRTY